MSRERFGANHICQKSAKFAGFGPKNPFIKFLRSRDLENARERFGADHISQKVQNLYGLGQNNSFL